MDESPQSEPAAANEDRRERPVRLRAVVPAGSPRTPEEVASGLRLGDLAPAERPYLVLNMVATLDGKAALGGRTRGIGSPADRELFHHLRTQADAVMFGAETLRTERFGRLVRDPERREKRRREGLAPDPLACVVSSSLRALEDLPLLAAPEQPVALITGAHDEIAATAAPVHYVRSTPAGAASRAADLGAALRSLRADHGVRSILCEGGPNLNAGLLRAGLVDELFLSVAPKLAGGGEALTIVAGAALPEPVDLELVWMLERRGELFTRWRLSSGSGERAAPS